MESSSKTHELPFIHRVARQKWEFLQEQGYVEVGGSLDQGNLPDGIEFHHPYQLGKGFIDWWGKVTWYE